MTQAEQKPPRLTLIYFTDPGHGWLAVAREQLLAFDEVALTITPYSYQLGEIVYLEEDRDASSFLEAAKAADLEIEIKHQSSNTSSQIRNYKPFCLSESEQKQLQNRKFKQSILFEEGEQ